jgi:hypothetical protein
MEMVVPFLDLKIPPGKKFNSPQHSIVEAKKLRFFRFAHLLQA